MTALHSTGDKPFTDEKIHRRAKKRITFKLTFAMLKNNLMIQATEKLTCRL